jgi:hypothetical protein
MPAKKSSISGARKLPVGDRRQFLTIMSADVIKAVKQAALDDDRNAWEIMEEAALQWLERRRGQPKTRHFTSYKQPTDHELLTLSKPLVDSRFPP